MGADKVNPTNYDAIPAYVPDSPENLVHAVIETPAQIRHKYAFVPKYGAMTLKLTLAEGLTWPYDYGFIPETLADDGDPTDVLVINDTPTFSGCLLEVRVLGAILAEEERRHQQSYRSLPPEEARGNVEDRWF